MKSYCPKNRKKQKNGNRWSDDNLLIQLIKDRNTQLKKIPTDKVSLKKANKNVKSRVNALMNKHYSTEAIKINAFKEQNKTHEMYKTAKNQKTGFKQFKQTEISADLLKDHFKKHFKRKHTCDQIPQSLEHPPIEVQSELWQLSEEFPIDNSIPSQEEVKRL